MGIAGGINENYDASYGVGIDRVRVLQSAMRREQLQSRAIARADVLSGSWRLRRYVLGQ